MKRVAVLALLLACNPRSTADAGTTPSASIPAPSASTPAPPAFVVDDATVTTCTLAYRCGISHPHLGSSSRTTTVDFSTCTRTSESESRPWRDELPRAREDASAPTSTKSTAQLSPADCARIRAALTAVTPADARAAQESAQMDSEACDVSLSCKGDAAPRMSVQRQTISGSSRVEALIRALLGVR